MAEIQQFHFRFGADGDQTISLPRTHAFIQKSAFVQGKIRREPLSSEIQFPDLNCEFFRKYVVFWNFQNMSEGQLEAVLPRDQTKEDLPEIYCIADYLADDPVVEKVTSIAVRLWELKEVQEQTQADENDPIVGNFWSTVFYEKFRFLPLEEWKKQLETVTLDPSLTIAVLLKSFSSERQNADTPSKMLLSLAAYYERDKQPFDRLIQDFPLILKELAEVRQEVKEKLLLGLIELSIYLLRKKNESILYASEKELPHSTLTGNLVEEAVPIAEEIRRKFQTPTNRGFTHWLSTLFRPKPLTDAYSAVQLMGAISKYQKICQEFLKEAPTEERRESLRRRVEGAKIEIRYPWNWSRKGPSLVRPHQNLPMHQHLISYIPKPQMHIGPATEHLKMCGEQLTLTISYLATCVLLGIGLLFLSLGNQTASELVQLAFISLHLLVFAYKALKFAFSETFLEAILQVFANMCASRSSKLLFGAGLIGSSFAYFAWLLNILKNDYQKFGMQIIFWRNILYSGPTTLFGVGLGSGLSLLKDYDSYQYYNQRRNENPSSRLDRLFDQAASHYSHLPLKYLMKE